jgi:putative redox protein
LTVDVQGTRRDEEPKRFVAIHLRYTVAGDALDRHKVERAVNLAITKYCSVISSLAPDIAITSDVVVT